MGEYEKAIEYLEKANNVFGKKLSSSLPPPDKNTNTETYFDHAFVLNNLGMCKRSSGDYDGSLKNYEQAYAIYAKYLGETHPNTKIVLENLEKTKQMSGSEKTRKKSVKPQPKLINKDDLASLVKVDTGNVVAQATSMDVTPVKLSKEEMAKRKKEEEKQKKEEEKRKKLEEKQAKEEAKRKKKEDDRRIKEALKRAKEAEKKRVEEEKKKKKADEKARLEEEKRKKKEGKVSTTAASSSKIQKSNENSEREDVARQALISKVESRTVDERDNENNNNFAKKGKKSKGCCF